MNFFNYDSKFKIIFFWGGEGGGVMTRVIDFFLQSIKKNFFCGEGGGWNGGVDGRTA